MVIRASRAYRFTGDSCLVQWAAADGVPGMREIDDSGSRRGDGAPGLGAAADLRRQAEARLEALSAATAPPVPADVAAVIHELRVHQVELEIQNEELRRVELELDAQREKYFDLFDLAPVGYLTLSDRNIVGDANLTAARMLGVERRKLLGRPLSAFMSVSDADALYRHLRSLAQTGSPQTCELRLRPDDGDPFWARLESRPSLLLDGEPLVYHVAFTDVDETVAALAALRESEATYRDVVERANDGIAVIQGDVMVLANEALARMSGYSVNELTGLPFTALVQERERERIAERVRRRLAYEEAPSEYEIDLVRRDGRPFTVEVGASVVSYGGAPADLVLLRDVTAARVAEEALRESEARYRSLFEDNHAVMLLIDPASGSIVDANPAACSWYGWSRDEMLAMRIDDLNTLAPEEVRAEMELARAEKRRVFDFRHRRADGTIHDVEVYSGPIQVGGRTLLYSLVQDVTERRLAEAALRESEARFKAIAEYAASWECWFSPQGKLLWMNGYSVRLTGHVPEEYIAATDFLSMTIAPEDLAWVSEQFQGAVRGSSGDNVEMRILRNDGSRFWASVSWRPILDAEGRSLGFRTSTRDITEQKQAETALARLNFELAAKTNVLEVANATITRIAATDALTGLASRRSFYDSLEKAISLARRHASPLALVSFDLDGLKRTNDTTGHEAGDEVLASFGALLGTVCRLEDVAGRLGGDEFGVLLPGTDLAGARRFGERVVAAVRSHDAMSRRGVTASGGIAAWALDELPDDLLRRADEALYAAKRGGGDIVVADPTA